MSNEYLSSWADYPPEPDEYQRRLNLIDEIRAEAFNIAQALNKERPYEGDIDDAIEHTRSGMRITRLRELSDAILAVSQNEYPRNAQIDLNEQRFIADGKEATLRKMPQGFFSGYETELEEAVTIGARMGTNDILSLLSQKQTIDEGANQLCFFPWRRDALEAIGRPLHYNKNGQEEIAYPTRLPNIKIVHTYGPGKYSLPNVTARLVEYPTLPSLPQ